MKSKILVLVLMTIFVPIFLFAQGVIPTIIEKATALSAIVLPVITYVVTNFLKPKFQEWFNLDGKAFNWVVYLLVAVLLFIGYAQLGFPKLSFMEFFGNTNALWGFIEVVKNYFKKEVPPAAVE